MKCKMNLKFCPLVAVFLLTTVLFPDGYSATAIIIYIPLPWLTLTPAPVTLPVATTTTTSVTVTPSPTPTPQQLLYPEFQTSALNSINVYRSLHQAPAVVANTASQLICQGCANGYAAVDSLATPCRLATGELGDVFATCPSPRLAAFQLMNRWYNEVANVTSYANLAFSTSYQHFTQLVWLSTTQVCCALSAITATRRCYASCIFSTPGNINGAFTQNVLPPN